MGLPASRQSIPPGRAVVLPGRGTTWVREVDGPPGAPVAMLLHGLGATAALNWAPAFGPLSQSFRVVAIDHRGHGRGIRTRRFRLADCADDVVALADTLGVDRFIAVGYSMGGPIAQLAAYRHPDRVEGLVLCATSRDFRGKPAERLQFAALGMAAAVSGLLPARRTLAVPVEGAAVPDTTVADELRRSDPITVLQAAEALGRFTSRAWLGSLTVPTSVVLTTRDRLVPLRRQSKLLGAIAGAVGHPVEGGHLDCAASPARFGQVVTEACEVVAARCGYPIEWLTPAAVA